MERRALLKGGLGAAGIAMVGGAGFACSTGPGPTTSLLGEADTNGIRLPTGFTSRVLARSQQVVSGLGHTWHANPDGGAVFPTTSGGWIYVSNSEHTSGGVGALEFNSAAVPTAARSILTGTQLNCAGGASPWGTWLSCEEISRGKVWECDPTGLDAAVVRPALGSFRHEAVAADPFQRRLYLTEDQPDGRLYRFTPDTWGSVASGLLEVAVVDGANRVTWVAVPNPNPTPVQTSTRYQVGSATVFNGGEGIVVHDQHVYFSTKGDNRVWDLDLTTGLIGLRYDFATSTSPTLSGVDNIANSADGTLYVAEDGGNMEMVMVNAQGRAVPCLQIVGQDSSELTGPAFDPSGTRLYFSSQRGPSGAGVTYEVTGPFAQFRSVAFS